MTTVTTLRDEIMKAARANMTKSKRIRGPRVIWTPEQEDILRTRYPHEKTSKIASDIGIPTHKVSRKASDLGLKKTPEYLASPDACRLRRGDNIGAATRFKKGHASPNKGIKGISYPGSVPTQFKKGHKLNDEAPLGALRINADGYLDRKISMTINPTSKRWVAVHRLVWIEKNGPVPKGHVVAFKPGMRTALLEEITLDKVELITWAEMMKRNSIHNYPKEIVHATLLRGAINRKINRRLKNERDNKAE